MSGNPCPVCGEVHGPMPMTLERPVTITMDAAMARRMLVGACWASEWTLVEALLHALASGEDTEVPRGI